MKGSSAITSKEASIALISLVGNPDILPLRVQATHNDTQSISETDAMILLEMKQ